MDTDVRQRHDLSALRLFVLSSALAILLCGVGIIGSVFTPEIRRDLRIDNARPSPLTSKKIENPPALAVETKPSPPVTYDTATTPVAATTTRAEAEQQTRSKGSGECQNPAPITFVEMERLADRVLNPEGTVDFKDVNLEGVSETLGPYSRIMSVTNIDGRRVFFASPSPPVKESPASDGIMSVTNIDGRRMFFASPSPPVKAIPKRGVDVQGRIVFTNE